DERSGQPAEKATEKECEHDQLVGIDTEQAGSGCVLGNGAQRLAHAGEVDEQGEQDEDDDRDTEDDDLHSPDGYRIRVRAEIHGEGKIAGQPLGIGIVFRANQIPDEIHQKKRDTETGNEREDRIRATSAQWPECQPLNDYCRDARADTAEENREVEL